MPDDQPSSSVPQSQPAAPAWPDPARPGVPLNPERDGWHWIGTGCHKWIARLSDGCGFWYRFGSQCSPLTVARRAVSDHDHYLGPCFPPAELTARETAAWVAGRDAAAFRVERLNDDRGGIGYGQEIIEAIRALTPPPQERA